MSVIPHESGLACPHCERTGFKSPWALRCHHVHTHRDKPWPDGVPTCNSKASKAAPAAKKQITEVVDAAKAPGWADQIRRAVRDDIIDRGTFRGTAVKFNTVVSDPGDPIKFCYRCGGPSVLPLANFCAICGCHLVPVRLAVQKNSGDKE